MVTFVFMGLTLLFLTLAFFCKAFQWPKENYNEVAGYLFAFAAASAFAMAVS